MNNKNTFILIFIFFLFTCEDNENEISNNQVSGVDDKIIEGRTVYVVGSSYDSEGNFGSCYWANGTRFELPGGAWATDITVVNGPEPILEKAFCRG